MLHADTRVGPQPAPSAATRRPRRLVLLATVAGCLITARLGWWQLDRAAQKEALQQQIESRTALPELDAAALARTPPQAEAQWQRRIRLQGRWIEAATIYLDNRTMQGRTGFLVLTPLQIGPGDAVLVQRGWVPRHRSDRTALPPLSTPAGLVEVHGRLAPAPSALLELGGGAHAPQESPEGVRPDGPDGRIRQNLDIDALARELHLPLRPLTLLQLDAGAAPPSGDDLLRQWPAPTARVHVHYGYAAQWFALCGLIAGLHVWFQVIRPRRRARQP